MPDYKKEQERFMLTLILPLYNTTMKDTHIIPRLSYYNRKKLKDAVFGREYDSEKSVYELFRHCECNQNIYIFENFRRRLSVMSDQEKANYINSFRKDSEERLRASLAAYYLKRLPQAGISGYYYTHNIYYARCAGAVHLLAKNEAIHIMRDFAIKIQTCYNSWQEYSTAFCAGHLFSKCATESISYFYEKNGSFLTWLFSGSLPDWNMQL